MVRYNTPDDYRYAARLKCVIEEGCGVAVCPGDKTESTVQKVPESALSNRAVRLTLTYVNYDSVRARRELSGYSVPHTTYSLRHP